MREVVVEEGGGVGGFDGERPVGLGGVGEADGEAGIAVAVGKDSQGVEHTWSSNPVSVPTVPSAK